MKKLLHKYFLTQGKYVIKLHFDPIHYITPTILYAIALIVQSINSKTELTLKSFLHIALHEIYIWIGVYFTISLISSLLKQYTVFKSNNGNSFRSWYSIYEDMSKDIKSKNYSHFHETNSYLEFIDNRIANGLRFEPDLRAIDELHLGNGLLAITEADPVKWINPTYNFYLLNNLLTTFTNNINLSTITNIDYSNSSNENSNFQKYIEYQTNRKKILREIADISNGSDLITYFKTKPSTIRFYFLTEEQIKNRKTILEILISYHELFGSYLYIINKDKLNFNDSIFAEFKLVLERIKYKLNSNSNLYDVAFSIENSSVYGIYNDPTDLNKLSKTIIDKSLENITTFFKDMCNRVHANFDDENYVISNKKLASDYNYVINSKLCHAYINRLKN
ncbi:hypothetical protein H6790_03120 [Candidatus Nomurabacteria bacterium]|nr:hypothetical protein [Bacteroidota bacterium]MCB9820910.1 hypothetical protein [Candidatus Nomurabacteria bacterium]